MLHLSLLKLLLYMRSTLAPKIKFDCSMPNFFRGNSHLFDHMHDEDRPSSPTSFELCQSPRTPNLSPSSSGSKGFISPISKMGSPHKRSPSKRTENMVSCRLYLPLMSFYFQDLVCDVFVVLLTSLTHFFSFTQTQIKKILPHNRICRRQQKDCLIGWTTSHN